MHLGRSRLHRGGDVLGRDVPVGRDESGEDGAARAAYQFMIYTLGGSAFMLLAFAACLRRAGVNTIYLGPDVPLDDWKSVASEVGARAAVLGVHLESDVEAAQSVVDQLAALSPPVAVRVGGRSRHKISGARLLEDRVSLAAAAVARDLRAGAA